MFDAGLAGATPANRDEAIAIAADLDGQSSVLAALAVRLMLEQRKTV